MVELLILLTAAYYAAQDSGKAGTVAAKKAWRPAYKKKLAELRAKRAAKLKAVRGGAYNGQPLWVHNASDRTAAFLYGAVPACKAFVYDAKTGWKTGKARAQARFNRTPEVPVPAPVKPQPAAPAAPQLEMPANVHQFKIKKTAQNTGGTAMAIQSTGEITSMDGLITELEHVKAAKAAELEAAQADAMIAAEEATRFDTISAGLQTLNVDPASVGEVLGLIDPALAGLSAAQQKVTAAETAYAQADAAVTNMKTRHGLHQEAAQNSPVPAAAPTFYGQ